MLKLKPVDARMSAISSDALFKGFPSPFKFISARLLCFPAVRYSQHFTLRFDFSSRTLARLASTSKVRFPITFQLVHGGFWDGSSWSED